MPVDESSRQHADSDAAAELSRLGYAQELFRTMGGFSNFAISFSIISILTGAMTLFDYGLKHGGPAQMGLGWPLVFVFTMMVVLSMAELAAAYPTSGAMYHWSTILGGRTWGWFTAWMSMVGLFSAVAAIDYGCAQNLAPLLRLPSTPGTLLLIYAVILLGQAVINQYGVKLVAWLNDASVAVHILGVVAVVGALFLFAPLQPAYYFFQRTTTTEHPYWWAFILGLLQAQWTFTGYEASAHVAEETHDPRRRVPWGMVMSVLVSGVFGYALLAAMTLAIPDVNAALSATDGEGHTIPSYVAIFQHALGGVWGSAVQAMVCAAQWFCGLSAITSLSRAIFAFARDEGMPGSAVLRRVHPARGTPGPAIWLTVTAAFVPLIATLYWPDTYSVVASVSTIGLYLAYCAPVALKLRKGSGWKPTAEWNLGRWSTPINVLAIGWTVFIAVVLVMPPNMVAGVTLVVIMGALAAWYAVSERHRYQGPKVMLGKHGQDASR